MKKSIVMFILVLLVLMPSCSSKESPRKDPAVPVTAATAVRKTIPVRLEAIGTVEAFQTISVRTQITAEIKKVHFREGQDVKKGDLLVELDSGPSEATLKQAQANLAKDRAQAKYAREQAVRYADLIKKDYIAKEQYDQIVANAASLEAAVKADEAYVENSRLQVRFCSIYAPVDGRIGKLEVDQGNIAKANDMELFTINQIQPVNVVFAIPEKDLSRVKKYFSGKKLAVEAEANEGDTPEKGELSFLDNAIDKNTGTITLKGTFANKSGNLWPGQFVSVALTLTTLPDAILVPSQSVEQGPSGQYVYVIKPGSVVEMRPVTTGEPFKDETIILQGLQAGEQVVTDGQLRLTPGARISIKGAK